MDEYLTFAKQIALQAGDIMLRNFRNGVDQREKIDKTIATRADEEINELVIKGVASKYPDHAVFGEEASSKHTSKDLWVCDPIDGTFLFSKGIPCSVFSLAYVEDGDPKVGVIYDPFLKRLYSAIKGGGAYLNDDQIHVSSKKLDYRAALDVEDWPNSELNFDPMIKLGEKELGLDFYAIGSVAYTCSLVACGSFEAVVFAGKEAKSVDIAAAKIIVDEAGGKVTDAFGNEQRYDGDINGGVISNGVVHNDVISLIQRSR